MAQQNIELLDQGSSVFWRRTGSGSELSDVRFTAEFLDDGSTLDLGLASPVDGGWLASGLSLPEQRLFSLNVQGNYGTQQSSRGSRLIISKIFNLTPAPDDSMCFPIVASNGKIAVICL